MQVWCLAFVVLALAATQVRANLLLGSTHLLRGSQGVEAQAKQARTAPLPALKLAGRVALAACHNRSLLCRLTRFPVISQSITKR